MTEEHSTRRAMRELVLAGIALAVPSSALAAGKLTLAIPAPPDGFSSLPALVAQDIGFFRHYGLGIKLVEMKSGAAATKAVLKGDVDLAFAPTQFTVQIAANTGASLKAIWGLDRPDWLLGSVTASEHECNALKGAKIAVDARHGTRRTQLNSILLGGCNLKIDKDYKAVPVGANIVEAMISGKIRHGLLHVDEARAIEIKSGRPLHTIATLEAVQPGLHHLLLIARPATIKAHRKSLLRLVAALRDASRYIVDPANEKIVAGAVRTIYQDTNAAMTAIRALNAMTFYPARTAGLDKSRIAKTIQMQQRIGKFTKGRSGIKPGRAPVSADDIIDMSLWNDATRLK